MTFRKFLKYFIVLFLLVVIIIGIISINHPIILKWLTGDARIIGKPINATVYANGQINDGIKVYHTEKYWESNKKANNYLLSLKEFDNVGKLKFFNVNLIEKWIGRPVGTSKNDYDFVLDYLIQSETGGHFVPFQDDIKGYNFDPQLSFTEKQIKFNVPPNKLKFDSVRIELK